MGYRKVILALVVIASLLTLWIKCDGDERRRDVSDDPLLEREATIGTRELSHTSSRHSESETALHREAVVDPPRATRMERGSLVLRFHRRENRSVPVTGVKCQIRGGSDAYKEGGQSNAEGLVKFDSIPAGRVYLETFFTMVRAFRIKGGENGPINIAVPSAFNLSGRVVDAKGEPLAGAGIYMTYRGTKAYERVAQSDANGEFFLLQCHVESYCFASAPKHASSVWRYVTNDAGSGMMVFRLGESKSITGFVVGPKNQRIPGALVIVGRRVQSWVFDDRGRSIGLEPVAKRTFTDESGRFLLDRIPKYRDAPITVLANGYAVLSSPPPRENKPVVELRLKREKQVSGTIRGPLGEPLMGAKIEWGDPRSFVHLLARSDREGQFRLRGMPVGLGGGIRVCLSGYVSATVAISPADNTSALEVGLERRR